MNLFNFSSQADLKSRILGVCIDSGLGFGGKPIGVSNWYDPGVASNGFLGFISVIIIAAFAYSGTELVCMTAAEMQDVQFAMPKAVRNVFWRITIVGNIFILMAEL